MLKLKSSKWQHYVLFLINSLVIFILFFRKGVICGWDLQFHLNRIEELHQSLISGHLLSSNGSFAFSQIGLIVNKFYPYLFLYPFAIMRGLADPVLAYNICLFVLTALSFIIAYQSVISIPTQQGEKRRSAKAGFLFSLIYNNSGYLLLQITQRGDLAEYIALVLLPVLFMGLISLIRQQDSKKWWWLPITFTLIAYSHLLSAILFALFVMVILGLNYHQLNVLKIERLIISGILVVIATLPISLTIVLANHQNKVITPIVPDTLQNEALKPDDLLLNALNNIVPDTLSVVNLGVITLVCLFISFLILGSHDLLGKQLTWIGVFSVFLSTNLFPWFIFQRTPLHVIQFPWRFIGITTFCIAYVAAKVLQSLINRRCALLLVFITVNLVTLTYMHNFTHNGNQIIAYHNVKQYERIATNAVYTDYMPSQTLAGMDPVANFRKKSDIHSHIAVVNGRKVKLHSNQIKPGYNQISYQLTGLNAQRVNHVTLPLLNYGNNHANRSIKTEQTNRGTTIIIFHPRTNKAEVTIYLK